MPGISTGWEGDDSEEEERRLEGKARDDRYVEAVRNRSLAQASRKS